MLGPYIPAEVTIFYEEIKNFVSYFRFSTVHPSFCQCCTLRKCTCTTALPVFYCNFLGKSNSVALNYKLPHCNEYKVVFVFSQNKENIVETNNRF